jgi:hypothetical protein
LQEKAAQIPPSVRDSYPVERPFSVFSPAEEIMKLEELLTQRASRILKRWLDLIFDTYPADAQRFLRKQKDPFANPVGSTLSRELENLYREFLGKTDPDKMASALDGIVRIRAIQGFAASEAVAFIFVLKRIIREETSKEVREERLATEELLALESRLDDLALKAFDVYMTCKEKVFEIRAKEARNHVSGLLRRAGLTAEIPEWDSDPQKSPLT